MKKQTALLAGAAVAALITTAAAAETLPDSKSGVAMGDLGVVTTGSMHGPFLTTYIKVAQQKELVFDLSLECGLYTDTLVRSKGGNKDTSEAEASVQVNIRVTDEDGNWVYAYPGGEGKGVTYCRRSQTLSAVFQGLITNADGEVCLYYDDNNVLRVDEECLRPEEVQLILDTMNANAFNFVSPNLDQGIYKVEVLAEIKTDGSKEEGSWNATATLGRGSLVVDEVRFIQGADGQM